jgi:CheY-like chemotaxis protein
MAAERIQDRQTLGRDLGDDTAMNHTVLYIDDSEDNLVLVERMLRRRQDVWLRVARTGHDGIEAALSDPPSLILLDNRLPDSNGLEVLLQLAASPATAAVPVVVLSGDSGQTTVKDLLAAGASDFLAKPFAMAELLATVARFLDDGSG